MRGLLFFDQYYGSDRYDAGAGRQVPVCEKLRIKGHGRSRLRYWVGTIGPSDQMFLSSYPVVGILGAPHRQ